MHIATLGYVFMGVGVAVQEILQGLWDVYKPIIISLLRLIVFVVPRALFFCFRENVITAFWWMFVIAEALTAICVHCFF